MKLDCLDILLYKFPAQASLTALTVDSARQLVLVRRMIVNLI
jgi:hypothetical protein